MASFSFTRCCCIAPDALSKLLSALTGLKLLSIMDAFDASADPSEFYSDLSLTVPQLTHLDVHCVCRKALSWDAVLAGIALV